MVVVVVTVVLICNYHIDIYIYWLEEWDPTRQAQLKLLTLHSDRPSGTVVVCHTQYHGLGLPRTLPLRVRPKNLR